MAHTKKHTYDSADDHDGSLSWSKVNKTGSNLSDLATKSHTSLSDVGSKTHNDLDNHVNSTSNPHAVTATQAGALPISGGKMTGNIDMDSKKIENLPTPLAAGEPATKGYVDAFEHGLDWQESVKNMLDFTTAEPDAPRTTGDRYINTVTGNAEHTNQAVTAKYIYEWNGTDWTEIIPDEGTALRNEADDKQYVFNGTSWVGIGTGIDHADITNVTANQHHSQAHSYDSADHTGTLSFNKISTNVTNDAQVKKIASSVADNVITWADANGNLPKDSGVAITTINNGLVTNGNSHDHNGGDGAQIDHVNLSNKGTNTHTTIDTFLTNNAEAKNILTLPKYASEADPVAGQLVALYNDGGTLCWRIATNVAATNAYKMLAIVQTGGASVTAVFLKDGLSNGSGLTIAGPVYLSTAGGVTATQPTGSGNIVKIVGYASSATNWNFRPDQTFIELL